VNCLVESHFPENPAAEMHSYLAQAKIEGSLAALDY
jgi:hypothetical protein